MHFITDVILPAEKFERPVEEIIKEYKETNCCPKDVFRLLTSALDPFWEELNDESQEDCEVCGGTGLVTRMINLDALWIADDPDMPEGAKNIPRTVVLEDEDDERHYWFDTLYEEGSYEEQKPRIQEAWGELMERHKGDIVVRVDCHI